nr:hypothetical protein [uncultured Cellulosilyticum sp.]
MDKAMQYAKRKIAMFPEAYKAYTTDIELFKILVEDCRKQLEVEQFSLKLMDAIGEAAYEKSVI